MKTRLVRTQDVGIALLGIPFNSGNMGGRGRRLPNDWGVCRRSQSIKTPSVGFLQRILSSPGNGFLGRSPLSLLFAWRQGCPSGDPCVVASQPLFSCGTFRILPSTGIVGIAMSRAVKGEVQEKMGKGSCLVICPSRSSLPFSKGYASEKERFASACRLALYDSLRSCVVARQIYSCKQ